MKEVKKVKRRKFNILKFLIFILFLYIAFYLFKHLFNQPIKNIIILNNQIISDETIIETAGIDNYPSFIKTSCSKTCKNVKSISLVNSCKCSKLNNYILKLDIEEKKILYQIRSTEKYVLNTGEELELMDIVGIPLLINYIPEDIEEKMVKNFSKLDKDTIEKISEIEYSPTTYDQERFILYMSDANMVYMTLGKTEKLNKYDEIKVKLDNHKGILYLDSGNYFEIKE